VSITKHVVTLVDPPIQQRTRRGKLGWDNVPNIRWDQYAPSPHLAPQEWNQQLLLSSSSSSTHDPDTRPQHDDYDAILVDARNVYESSIGHFKVMYSIT
jgi:predicted sulfurtransferase